MTRVVDRDALRAAREAWIPVGCAICQEPIWELHHLKKRSAGGGDQPGNLIALCGEFQKNHHHRDVEDGLVEIYSTQNGGLAWLDHRTGESGVCKVPPGGDRGVPFHAPVAQHPPGDEVAPTAPTAHPRAVGVSIPQERFAWLQTASQEASRAYLVMAVMLDEAKAEGDWKALGFESWHDYYGEAGLGMPKSTVSKMLRVAAFYREEWRETLASGASVEKLYLAAGAATSVPEALGLAKSMPAYELRALAKGEPAPGDVERCPVCGQVLR